MREILILIVTLFLNFLHAQTSINGLFVDEDNKPKQNIAIDVLNLRDSTKIKSTSSDLLGKFIIMNIDEGDYILSYTSSDNNKSYINITVGKTEYNIGKIVLNNDYKNINEVKILKKKALFESDLDKITVNVQENITSAGGTALEILNRSPGVSINRAKNTISLNGKEGILMMIDGKISKIPIDALMQMLESMPSQNIEKIELIANPSAKYDSGSTGGIINILTHQGKQIGLNGSLSLIGGWGGKERLGATGNINYKKEKWNLYSDFGYYRNHNKQTYIINREINNHNYNITNNTNNTYTNRDPLSNYISGKIGVDYNLNKDILIGGFISGMSDIFDLKANTTNITFENNSNSSYVETENVEFNNWSNITINGYLNKKIKNKQEINFDLSYLHYYNNNRLDNINRYFDNLSQPLLYEKFEGSKNAPIDSWIGTIDYNKLFSENSKVEIGTKASYSDYYNNITVLKNENIDPSLTQRFKLKESIFAIYSIFNHKFNDKTNLQIGLRYENFDLQSESTITGNIKRNSNNFFPSFFLSHNFDKKNTLQISYSKRVERPAYNDFAPYYVFFDPSTSLTGNTELNQSLINIYKIDFKHSNTLFTFQYSHDEEGISRFQPVLDAEKNMLYFTSLNLKYKDQYLFSISFPFKITQWLNIQNNIMIGKQVYRTQKLPIDITLNNNYFKANSILTFTLSPKITSEISAFYRTAELYGLSKNKNFGNINISFAKKMNDKSKLTLSMNNVLGVNTDWDIVDHRDLQYKIIPEYKLTPFIIRLTFTYSFGSKNDLSSKRKESNVNEVNNRVR